MKHSTPPRSFILSFLSRAAFLFMCLAGSLLSGPRVAHAAGGGGSNTKQMRAWSFTSTTIDFSSGGATQVAQTSGTNNPVAAAAFSSTNQLLFYIPLTPSIPTVYSAANQSIGTLNYIVNPNKSFDEGDWVSLGKEMVVVPVPGACQKYYVIYNLGSNYSSIIAYAIIDCSSGSPVIAVNSTRLPTTTLWPSVGGMPSLAASTPDADGTRKLYIAGGDSFTKCTIGNNPTGATGMFSGFSTYATNVPIPAGSSTSEAELSPDGQYIAWAVQATGPSGAATVIVRLAANGQYVATITPTYQAGTAHSVNGLEFSSNSDKLFMVGHRWYTNPPGNSLYSASGGAVYSISSQQQVALDTNGKNLATNTQLELAFDNQLYAATSSGQLLTISPTTNVVAASPLTMTMTTVNSQLYGFPDQIDGEDYTALFGNYAPTLSASIFVDGRALIASTARTVYSCNPLTLTMGTSSLNITKYTLAFNSTDANGNVTSAYNYTYTTPSLPVNLGALNGGYLANPANAGYYRLQITGSNTCGQTAQRTVRMLVANLTPGSAGLAFSRCNGAVVQAASTSLGSPAIVGSNGGATISIAFSTGDYDYYQVQFAKYVNGSFQDVGLLANITKPTGQLNAIALNYIAGQADLGTTYFVGNNAVFRMTLTVSNACGTSPPLVGYFQPADASCRSVSSNPVPVAQQVPLYPNPLTGSEAGHLRFSLPTAQPVSLVLTDALSGQVRLTVLQNAPRPAGEQEVSFSAAGLPAGVYLYRLTTAAGTTTGRVLKAN